MSYHGMGVSPALTTSMDLQISVPLQITNLPSTKGSVRLDGPTSRRIEKGEGQRSLGVSVPAGTYQVFFRPEGGRYEHLGEVTVPEDDTVTFDAGAGYEPVTELRTTVATKEPSGGGEAQFVYTPTPGSGVQPKDTEEGGEPPIPPGERRLPPPAGPGAPDPGIVPNGGGGPGTRGGRPRGEIKAPPASDRPNWVPWAIGAGAVALVGLGAWWLTQR